LQYEHLFVYTRWPLIACLLIPGFELRAALRSRPGLELRPAALAPVPGTEPLLGPVTTTAEAAGVRPGMRLGEALATCPELVLVDPDPSTVEREWEGVLQRLEDVGLAVESVEPGVVVFETKGVERLYGGVAAALERALAAVGTAWDPRAGAAGRRFAALAAASVARPGQILIVEGKDERDFLAPLPLSLLPLSGDRYAELEGLGVRKLGELAALPGGAVAERLGPEGRSAWRLARGGERRRVRGRTPTAELAEVLSFPEAVGNELTLRRAFGSLLDRLLARPERAGRPFRKVAVAARLVGGGSWRRTVTLRDATADRGRLRAALGPKLLEIPAPVVELRLEAVQLAEHTGTQLALVEPTGAEIGGRLREGLRQVRASAGSGAVCAVVEVAPWSRIPEARAMVVPRDE
jgi:nucleotidyltransferase/DNA polymerase involved in DNA repair